MVTNKLDRYEVPVPGEINDKIFTECRTFIRLLFDDEWNYSNYSHCYISIIDRLAWPTSILDRLMVYGHTELYSPCCDSTNTSLLYEPCDSTATDSLNTINHRTSDCCDSTSALNIFSLTEDDFLLLDALNIYRCDSTAVVIYEQALNSNSLLKIPENNRWLLTISFESLNTVLSKLIFIYLNLKINLEYNFYMWDGTNYLSTNLFEHLYELYVIDNIFQYIVKNGPDYIEQ